MLIDKPYSQIAYFVADVRLAAMEHHRTYGSGPFYVADNVQLPFCEYRGQPAIWNMTSAFGQWGDVQVEFMQQDDDSDSIFHDVFPARSGRYGMHHIAFIIDDLWAVGRALEQQGHQIALHARMANGIEALLIDTIRSNGHMLELYEPTPPLLDLYDFIRTQSIEFDGINPVRAFDVSA
ncbi:MAG: VOC family protein [Pseudomonadota bacterium]